MRIVRFISIGSVVALPMLATPASAKHSDARKAEDRSAASSCHSYQQAADGSWKELPCAEVGAGNQTQHKSITGTPNEEAH